MINFCLLRGIDSFRNKTSLPSPTLINIKVLNRVHPLLKRLILKRGNSHLPSGRKTATLSSSIENTNKGLKGHCTENHIFFFQMFWKNGLSKKLYWNLIFLVLSRKMIFLFPENIILFFRLKRKDDFFQKNTWKYDAFLKCSGKIVFPKKSHWNMIFFVISRNMVLHLSRKCVILS